MVNIVYTDYNEISVTEYGTPVFIPNATASYVEFNDVQGLSQFSSSISDRTYNLENFSSSLNASFATDNELNLLSQSLNQSIQDASQSLYDFKLSFNTGSFTGSFTGDGSELYGIPASGITGLNLSQIQSGSVSASISPQLGFRVNTNSTFNGSLTANSLTGSLFGTASYAVQGLSSSFANTSSYSLTATSASYVNITGLGGVTGTGVAGQVSYWNGTNTQTGSNNLFWDAANNRLGIGTATPITNFDITVDQTPDAIFRVFHTRTSGAGGNFAGFDVGSARGNNRFIMTAGGAGTPYCYFQSGNYAFNANRPLVFEGYNTNVGSDVEFRFANSYFLQNSGFGIARGTTLSARAHIRGSGTTSATTALLVQNSTPTALMSISDNGIFTYIDGGNFVFGTTTGTKIGTATNQKLSFFNSTPIVQPTGNIVDALSNIGLVATPTLYTSATATLTTAAWSLVGGYYEQDIANANITATSLVNIIPDNDDVQTVIDAEFLPANDSSAGSVKVYAKNLPTANIDVTIIILK